MDDTQNSLMEYFSKLKITGDYEEENDDDHLDIQSPSKEVATNAASAAAAATTKTPVTTTTTIQKTPPSTITTKSPSRRQILKEIINSNETDPNRSPKSSNNLSSSPAAAEQHQQEQHQQKHQDHEQLQLKTFEDIGNENLSPPTFVVAVNNGIDDTNQIHKDNIYYKYNFKSSPIAIKLPDILDNVQGIDKNNDHLSVNTTKINTTITNSTADDIKNHLTIGGGGNDNDDVNTLMNLSQSSDDEIFVESLTSFSENHPPNVIDNNNIQTILESQTTTTSVTDSTVVSQQPPITDLSESHLNLSINDEYQSLPSTINNDLFVGENNHSVTIIETQTSTTTTTTELSSVETTTINDIINNNNNNEEIDTNLTIAAILSVTINTNNNNNNNNNTIQLNELTTENDNESKTIKVDDLLNAVDDNQQTITVLNETIQIKNKDEITVGDCLDKTTTTTIVDTISEQPTDLSYDDQQLPVNDDVSVTNITFDNAQQNSAEDSIEKEAAVGEITTNLISTPIIASEITELNETIENRIGINSTASNSDSINENNSQNIINSIETNDATNDAKNDPTNDTLINDLNLSNKHKELNNCNVNCGSPSSPDSISSLNTHNVNAAAAADNSPPITVNNDNIGFHNKSIENNESYQSESSPPSTVNAAELTQEDQNTTILENPFNKTLNIPSNEIDADDDHNLNNQTINIISSDHRRSIIVQNNDNTFTHTDADPNCDRRSPSKGLMNETFFAETHNTNNFDTTFVQTDNNTNNNNLELLNQTVNMPSKDLPIEVKTPVLINKINNSIIDSELTQSQKRLSIRNDLFTNSNNDNSFNDLNNNNNKNQLISPLKCLPASSTNKNNENDQNCGGGNDKGADQTFILQNFNNDEQQLDITFKKPNLPPPNPFTMKSQLPQQSSQSFTNLSRKPIDLNPLKTANSICGFPPSSASPTVVDDSEFSTNGMIFNQSDFDVFLSKQSNATNKYEDLLIGRSSLLLNFDPLLGQQQQQQQLQKSRLPSTSEETIIKSLVDGQNSTILNNKNNNNQKLQQQQQHQQHQQKSKADKLIRNSELNLNTVAEENVVAEGAASLLLINSNNNNNSENNSLNTQTDIAGNVTMSVDIIKDMKIENDLKSFENHNLANQDKNNEYKMTDLEKKIKNEVLRSGGEDYEKKLKEYEAREENLLKRISEKDKTLAKFTGVLEAYEKAIAEMVSDKEKSLQNNDSKVVELKADRDLNFQHLMSLEATFADLHVKYERSKQITMQLKENQDSLIEKEKMLMQQLKAQEQRYDQMKSHAVQQLDIANNTLETLTKNHSIELTKLKAQLKKEEISRQSVCEQLQQKSKENDELVKICDELISGQGS